VQDEAQIERSKLYLGILLGLKSSIYYRVD